MPANRFPALSARGDGNRWRVTPTTASESGLDEEDRAHAEAAINGHLARQEERLAPFHLAWRQELPITTYREGATAFVVSEEFAARCAEKGGKSDTISGLPGELDRFVVETALERHGLRVAGEWRRGPVLLLIAALATLGALAGLCYMLIRAAGWPKLRDAATGTVVAIHAEAANRTRHVRAALAGRDPTATRVLFVGRLHIGRDRAEGMLAEHGWRHGFALAWDWPSALGGLAEGLRIGAQAAPAIRAAGYRPTFAQLVAMKLRIFLGTASAWRWRRSGGAPQTAVFGHVGRADTILLEQTMQRGGTRTVHWMHGVSVGRAYQGVSDLCATLCAHDSRWHDAALNYRANTAFALPRPAFRTGIKPGWAILTNMTHYGYTYFPSIGPAHELRLIGLVEELARGERLDPALVTWKPHPVFYQRDPEVRAVVAERLARAGFTLWPGEIMPFDEAAARETVIVTPSGVALDMLKVGRLPVLAEFQPIDPEHVLAHLAPRGHDLETLAAAIALARDPVRAEALFDQVWQRTGPGAIGTLEQIEGVLRG